MLRCSPCVCLGRLFEEGLDGPSELELNVRDHRRLDLEIARFGGATTAGAAYAGAAGGV